MNIYNKGRYRINRKMLENMNNLENRDINKEKINIRLTEKIKILLYNNKKKKGVAYQSRNDMIKMYYNKIIILDRKSNINILLKFQAYFLFYWIVSLLNMFYILCEFNQGNNLSKLSEIILKVKGTGNIKLFSDDFYQIYNSFNINFNDTSSYVEGNKLISNSDNTEDTSFIKIIWNNTILTMKNMFKNCDKILEIDLSNFDTSNINNTSNMFYNCSSLISINLSNFNTTNVKDMSYMFYGCSELISLDLSNFDTSIVTSYIYMFGGCKNLTFLNLSSFNTSSAFSMAAMFYVCSNLKSLDLSNFITSKVTAMSSMFSGCSSLKILDLSNFNTSSVQGMRYMLSGCKNLTSVNLSSFNTSKVTNMAYMFNGCYKLVSLNLSNFITSRLTNMAHMFNGCIGLTSLDISNFDTSKVTDMSYIFKNNVLLTSLDLSSFNTSNVTNMSNMFYNCRKIFDLDISNFDTSNVTNMSNMFYNCTNMKSLDFSNFNTSNVLYMNNMFGKTNFIYLNLSNFDTSKVVNMSNMFTHCSSLYSLDLSNFDTSKVENMSYLFDGCSNLYSVDISNFNTSNVKDLSHIFSNCTSLTSLNLYNFNTSQVKNMNYMFYNCLNLSSLNLSNFDTSKVNDTSNMFYNCSLITSLDLSNFNITSVNNFSGMFYGCTKMEYINLDISNIKINSTTNDIFFMTLENLMICSEKYDKENEQLFYLLLESKKYQCNNSNYDGKFICHMKNISLNNDYACDICRKNILINDFELNSSNLSTSCFETYDEYNENEIDMNIKSSYISTEIYLINETETDNNHKEFSDDILFESNTENNNKINIYTNDKTEIFFNYSETTLSVENYPSSYFSSNEIIIKSNINNITKIQSQNETLQNIIDNFMEEMNVIEIDNGKDKTIVEKNKTIILTSTQNQKNNEDENFITMNLGECENILKRIYNISSNDSLYILQVISEEEGMKIPKVEYEVYYPLDNSGDLTKLNLTLCQDTKIEISISVKINGSLDKYDPKSDYYNDICSKATSESGTDIPLKDRKNEFVNNNMSLCEENCNLIDYNPEKGKVKCSCDVKLSISQEHDIKFDKNEFFKSFTDINNILNIKIMKCYKTVLHLNNLLNNYGFLIVGSIIILYFFDLFIFINIAFSKIKKEVYNIIFALKIKGNPIKKKKDKNYKEKIKKHIKKKFIEKKSDKLFKNKLSKKNEGKNDNHRRISTQNISRHSFAKINAKRYSSISNIKKNFYIKILDMKDFELNGLDYKEAFKLDHRNYCEYYFSLLKNNHPILFSFGCNNDYNSKIIKIFLFFFSFCLDFAVNALFFTDDTMHKIYEDKGEFNILYQLPQIIYSTIITKFIDSFIRKFALSQDNIVGLKQENIKIGFEKRNKKLLHFLKIKFIIFFISTFIILIFLWYYVTSFCEIYANTQTHLIKDSVISLLTSFLIPFVLCIIPGIFRVTSLRVEKPTRKYIYNFSSFLENWLL